MSSSSSTGKYVPPGRRTGGGGGGGGASSSGTLMPLSSTKATQLRDWLNSLTTITASYLGSQGGGTLDVMQLNQSINMDAADRSVRYNVHVNIGKGTVGSTWIEGVTGVSINAQDNTRSGTLLQLWVDAKAGLSSVTTTTTGASSVSGGGTSH